MPGKRKYSLLAFLTLAVCVLAIYIHRHRQGHTGPIDNFLIQSSGSLQKHLFYFSRGFKSIVEHYVWLVNTKKRNEDLERELASLKSQLTSLKEVEAENSRLRDSLEFTRVVEQTLLPAHVVAHDVSTDYLAIRIDRGSVHGITVGMGVISPEGVVGRVHRVSPRYSDVLTLIDPTSNIDAVVLRSRARGVVSGQSKQLSCRFKYVDRLDDVEPNDTLVSSGFNYIFPKGLVIGYVTAVIPNPSGILQTVLVKSAVDIYRLEEVLVVLPPNEPTKAS